MEKIHHNNKYFVLTILLILFGVFLIGCNGGPISIDSPMIDFFIADVNTIEEGESAILSWQVTDADSVTISQGIGEVNSSGSHTVSPTETTTYILTASNSGGSVTNSAMITVNPADEEADSTIPTIHSFTSDYYWISPGGSANLSWEVSNADTVTIEPVFGEVNISGSASVSPSTTTTYTLTASNTFGDNTAEITIMVLWEPPDWWNGTPTPLPPNIESFSADKSFLTEGITATLSWEVSGIATVTIEPGIGEVETSGTHNVSPTETTTYTLTAGNVEGTVTETVTIVAEPVKIIQPGPAEGKDTWVCSNYKNDNNADYPSLLIGRQTGSYSKGAIRSLLQFNLSSIPDNAIITAAELQLYQRYTRGSLDSFTIGAHRITSSWQLNTVTWNTNTSFNSSPVDTIEVSPNAGIWISWNIKNLLQKWVNKTINNYGVLLKKTGEGSGGTYIVCWAADTTGNPNLRPKLEISYYVP
jgi:hypothetical protein